MSSFSYSENFSTGAFWAGSSSSSFGSGGTLLTSIGSSKFVSGGASVSYGGSSSASYCGSSSANVSRIDILSLLDHNQVMIFSLIQVNWKSNLGCCKTT